MEDTTKEKGIAAVEMALVLPVLAAMLFVLVEGAVALKTYSTLSEASREGARLVLREGTGADVSSLVESLTQGLPDTAMNTSVSQDPDQKTVTVEVSYEYHSFNGNDLFLTSFGGGPIVLKAGTTMPLP